MDATNNIEKILRKYSNINRLLNKKDILKLSSNLNTIRNPFTNRVNFEQFNLLSLITSEEYFDNSKRLLTLLNDYLSRFPELQESIEFKRNIQSLEKFAFFSYMTELSFARFLQKFNFSIDFNTKYIKENNGNLIERDIDIEATSSKGEKIYIEVYTPNGEIEDQGFYDHVGFGKRFLKKIRTKEFKKFENLKENQLFGKVFLAVNVIYDPQAQIYIASSASALYSKLEKDIHREVEGIIIFSHDLAKDDSLKIYRVLKKG